MAKKKTTAKRPAPRGATIKKASPRRTSKKSGKLTALDAAAKVLGEAKRPMSCNEMINAMAANGYWKTPAGKTPERTLYAAILREVNTKGKDARFKKIERGRFAASR